MLWWFVYLVTSVLRHDLLAPRDAKPLTPSKPLRVPGQRTSLRRNRTERSLVITKGPLAGTSIPLGSTPVTIGRAPDSTIVLDDAAISKNHAVITPHGEDWIIEDLGSTNGTRINKERIAEPTVLKRKVPITVGQTVLELR